MSGSITSSSVCCRWVISSTRRPAAATVCPIPGPSGHCGGSPCCNPRSQPPAPNPEGLANCPLGLKPRITRSFTISHRDCFLISCTSHTGSGNHRPACFTPMLLPLVPQAGCKREHSSSWRQAAPSYSRCSWKVPRSLPCLQTPPCPTGVLVQGRKRDPR